LACLAAAKIGAYFSAYLSTPLDEILHLDPFCLEGFTDLVESSGNDHFGGFNQHTVLCLDKGDQISLPKIELLADFEGMVT